MYKYLLVVWFIAGFSSIGLAQKRDTTALIKKLAVDTVISAKSDTDVVRSFTPKVKKEKIFHPDSTHSPRKAVIGSLIIPGWGQAYNKHWWKVPVVYVALGTLAYLIKFNADSTAEFQQLAIYREHGTVVVPGNKYYAQYHQYQFATNQQIYDAYNFYLRDRDLSILGFVGVWAINAIDAYIDAKFLSVYTIDDKLSMKVSPGVLNQPVYAQSLNGSFIPGFKITFTLR